LRESLDAAINNVAQQDDHILHLREKLNLATGDANSKSNEVARALA